MNEKEESRLFLRNDYWNVNSNSESVDVATKAVAETEFGFAETVVAGGCGVVL
jgi:hypothetical protein